MAFLQLLSPSPSLKSHLGYSEQMVNVQITNCHSMAGRQVIVLGRLSDMSIGCHSYEAELAAYRKLEKYANIDARCVFEPTAVETLGVINTTACHFLNDLGNLMTVNSGEATETGFLYQLISILIQLCCCMMVCPINPLLYYFLNSRKIILTESQYIIIMTSCIICSKLFSHVP